MNVHLNVQSNQTPLATWRNQQVWVSKTLDNVDVDHTHEFNCACKNAYDMDLSSIL